MSTEGERQLVVFELADEGYGIDINTVREIIRVQTVTHVPESPDYVEGVINLRGRVIPIVDVRRRFGLPVGDATPDTRVLVVDIGGEDIGVIVDAVTEVRRVANDSIQAPGSIATTEQSYYIQGIAKLGDRLLTLLDLERALRPGATPDADAARPEGAPASDAADAGATGVAHDAANDAAA